jgi:hypothetical protein
VSVEDDLMRRFLPAAVRRKVAGMIEKRASKTADSTARGAVNYAQLAAGWMAARQRAAVLRNDTWLEEALSFSGPNAAG